MWGLRATLRTPSVSLHRLRSDNIDGVVFASETKESIENAVRILLSTLGVSKK